MRSFNLSLALVSICYIALASYINPTFAQDSTPQHFLDAHDAARNLVGANPPLMFWNSTLAIYAQNYANAIRNANACNSQAPSGNAELGENLATSAGFMTGVQAVGLWTAEKANYNYPANTCNAGKVCKHYTQVVWKNSLGLGCARVQCASGYYYVICSYYPAGNVVGQLPY